MYKARVMLIVLLLIGALTPAAFGAQDYGLEQTEPMSDPTETESEPEATPTPTPDPTETEPEPDPEEPMETVGPPRLFSSHFDFSDYDPDADTSGDRLAEILSNPTLETNGGAGGEYSPFDFFGTGEAFPDECIGPGVQAATAHAMQGWGTWHPAGPGPHQEGPHKRFRAGQWEAFHEEIVVSAWNTWCYNGARVTYRFEGKSAALPQIPWRGVFQDIKTSTDHYPPPPGDPNRMEAEHSRESQFMKCFVDVTGVTAGLSNVGASGGQFWTELCRDGLRTVLTVRGERTGRCYAFSDDSSPAPNARTRADGCVP